LKVLHYNQTAGVLAPLSDKVENIILECAASKNVVAFYRYVCSRINEADPDIVHIYGAWDWHIGVVAYAAYIKNKALVYSPMRGIMSSALEWNPIKRRFWQFVTYQYWLIRNAYVLIMQDSHEDGIFRTTKLRDSGIEVLPEPSMIDEDVQKDFMFAIYNKTLDTNYKRYITPLEKQYVTAMVQLAVLDAGDQIAPPYIHNLSTRRIAFYAHDEDALEMMEEGARKLNMPMPELPEVTDDMRYPVGKRKPLGGFADKEVVKMIMASKKIGLKNLTLRHWAELYNMFRYVDFDEDQAAHEIKKHGLKKTTLKIQDYLTELFFLKPGYNIL
jgi:hypothetical protein